MEKSAKMLMTIALLATAALSLEGRELKAEPKYEPQTFPGFPGGPSLGAGTGSIPGLGGLPGFGGSVSFPGGGQPVLGSPAAVGPPAIPGFGRPFGSPPAIGTPAMIPGFGAVPGVGQP